jgi:hypothetical protein
MLFEAGWRGNQEIFSSCPNLFIPFKQHGIAIVLSLFALQGRARCVSCNGDEAIPADGIDCAVFI